MSFKLQKKDIQLEGSERHVHPNIPVVSASIRGPNKKISSKNYGQIFPKEKKHVVLENKNTEHIPIGPTLKNEIRSLGRSSRNKGGINDGLKFPMHQIATSSKTEETTFGAPGLHSTLRVAQALEQLRAEELDLPQMLETKLQSPTTASRCKKQTAAKVTVPSKKNIFYDLVAADVSRSNLVSQLQDQLNARAANVCPTPRRSDPAPSLSDYFYPEDFVITVRVTDVTVNFLVKSIGPSSAMGEKLCRDNNEIIHPN